MIFWAVLTTLMWFFHSAVSKPRGDTVGQYAFNGAAIKSDGVGKSAVFDLQVQWRCCWGFLMMAARSQIICSKYLQELDVLYHFHDRTLDGYWRMKVYVGPVGKITIISLVWSVLRASLWVTQMEKQPYRIQMSNYVGQPLESFLISSNIPNSSSVSFLAVWTQPAADSSV